MTAALPDPRPLHAAVHGFPLRARELGIALATAGAVVFTRLGEREFRANVQDRGTFTCELRLVGDDLVTRCTCKKRVRCEHTFAVLVREIVRRDQEEAKAPRAAAPVPKPAPAVASPKPAPAPRPTKKAPAAKPTRAAAAPPAATKAAAPAPPPPPARAELPAWRRRLQELQPHRPAGASPTASPLPVTFRIDAAASRRLGHLDVTILVPQKQEGAALRRLSNREEAMHFGETALRVLQQLRVLADDPSYFELPSAHQELKEPWLGDLLPLLFAAGHVQVRELTAGGEVDRVATLDAGPPFVLAVATTLDADRRTLAAELRRGDERLTAADLLLLTHRFALLRERVVPVAIPAASRRLASGLLTEGPLVTPRDADATVLPQLAAIAVDVPELRSVCDIVDAAPPVARLAIDTRRQVAGHWLAELRFDYEGTSIAADADPLLPALTEGGPLRRRAPEPEQAAERALRGAAAPHLVPTQMAGQFLVPPGKLMQLVQQLTAAGLATLVDDNMLRVGTVPQVRVRTAIDWFELEGVVQFGGGASLPLGQALAALDRGEHVVKLPDGSLALLPTAELQPWQKAARLGERHGDTVRVRRGQALLLDALLAARTAESTAIDEGFRSLCTKLSPRGGVPPHGAPKGFHGTLRPYQEQGLGWLHFLRELQLGGCLADDMGLGKTVQVLALLAEVHAAPRPHPTLLVAPRSLLDNWQREAARFAPALRVLDFHGSDRWNRIAARGFADFDLVVTTYGTLRLDVARFEERALQFEYAILDEAQAIGNASSATSKAVRLLRAEHRLALTGTPVMNHLGELWSLFEFLSPGLLGRNTTFQTLLRGERGADLDVALLHKALAPFLLRRTKAAVLTDLPPKQEQEIWCEMDGSQLATYDALRTRYQQVLLGGSTGKLAAQERFLVLEALLRLRQCACHEGLLGAAAVDGAAEPVLTGGSAKLDALLPMLKELVEGGHKALVFSQFTSFLALLRQRLDADGLHHEYLDGSTRDRQQRVDRFQQDPACPLFLVSLKAGGTGLNLTAADYVFLLDPWWNPAAESQATDRAHRLGQTRKVTVYRLVTKGTVEAKVLELQAKKRELADAVLGGDQSLLASLTREDLATLLG
jgi:superfamily II DNA or RNA helicase